MRARLPHSSFCKTQGLASRLGKSRRKWVASECREHQIVKVATIRARMLFGITNRIGENGGKYEDAVCIPPVHN